jgi:hypothetical protein
LLIAIDAEVGILTDAGKTINFVHTFRVVQAGLRQAVVYVHIAGSALETRQTLASRRQIPVLALGSVLTQRLPTHKAIINARPAQFPFPSTGALTGKVIERVDALGAILTRDELALV